MQNSVVLNLYRLITRTLCEILRGLINTRAVDLCWFKSQHLLRPPTHRPWQSSGAQDRVWPCNQVTPCKNKLQSSLPSKQLFEAAKAVRALFHRLPDKPVSLQCSQAPWTRSRVLVSSYFPFTPQLTVVCPQLASGHWDSFPALFFPFP